MGHIIFIMLHATAFLFFWQGLFVTLPAQIIYAAISHGFKSLNQCVAANVMHLEHKLDPGTTGED